MKLNAEKNYTAQQSCQEGEEVGIFLKNKIQGPNYCCIQV